MSEGLSGPFLRVDAIAESLGKSRQAIYFMLKDGSLPGCKLGKAWVIPKARFQKVLMRLYEHGRFVKPRRRKARMKPLRAYLHWKAASKVSSKDKGRAK